MFGRSNVLPCLSQSKFISADALLRHRGNAQISCDKVTPLPSVIQCDLLYEPPSPLDHKIF